MVSNEKAINVIINGLHDKFGYYPWGNNPISSALDYMNQFEIQPVPDIKDIQTPLARYCFPPDLVDQADCLAEESRIDWQGCLCATLGGINNALRGVYYVLPNGKWREPLIDYWMLLAPPSMMKSAIITSLRAPFEEFQSELEEKYAELFIDQEAIKQRKKDFKAEKRRRLKTELDKLVGADRENPEKVRDAYKVADEFYRDLEAGLSKVTYPRLFWSSGTMKGLAGVLAAQNDCLGVMESEDTFLVENLLTPRPEQELFLKGWDQGLYQRTVSGKDVIVKNTTLPTLLAVQHTVGNELFSHKRLAGRGALARFLTYWVPNHQYHAPLYSDSCPTHIGGLITITRRDYTRPKLAYEEYRRKIRTLLKRSWRLRKEGSFIEIPLSTEAKDHLQDSQRLFEFKRGQRDFEFLADWLGKAHGFLLRIAGDIHCWNNPEAPETSPISVYEMEAAKALLMNLEHHAEYSFSPNEVACCEDARRILRELKRWSTWPSYFDSAQFNQGDRGLLSAKIANALMLMQSLNQLIAIPKKRSGFYVIPHPRLREFLAVNNI